jgi:hypothetical protein
MNRTIPIILTCLLSCYLVAAQQVVVKKQGQKVKNESAKGFESHLEGNAEDIGPAWNKFLKDTGKGKSNGQLLVITEPTIGGTVYEKGILYATTNGSGEKADVWLGLIESEWADEDLEAINKEIEQIVYRFGVKYYKDKIQLQIDESLNAVQAVERQAQRLVSENKSLTNRLSNNEQQKIQLEKSLEENKLENLVLKQKLVNNANAQDSVARAGVQIQKVVEMHKERLMKVN